MINLIYVASGGAFGAILRLFTSNFYKLYFPNFPIGTLFINFLGSFLIGFLGSRLENNGTPSVFIEYFLIIGLLGSFTTFSAFSIETIELIKEGKISLSLLYVLLSFILSIFAAIIGLSLFKL